MTPLSALAVASAAMAGLVLAGTARAASRRLGETRRPAGPQSISSAGLVRWVRRRRFALLVAAGLVLAARAGPAAVVLAAVLAAVGSRRRLRSARQAAQGREQDQAAVALHALTAELRAGRTPAEALTTAAETAGPETAQVLRRAAAIDRLGGDVPGALDSGDRPPEPASGPALRMLSAAWLVGLRGGAGLATPIEHAADELAAAGLVRREVAAQLAGPRTTAVLLAGLPVLGLGLAALAGAAPVRFLFATPIGIGCLAAGVALDLIGVRWTDAIVAHALRRGA
jgi:tight adherence protein B